MSVLSQVPEVPGHDPFVPRYRTSKSERVCGQDRFKPPGKWMPMTEQFVVAGVYFRKDAAIAWIEEVRRAEAGGRPYGVEFQAEPSNPSDQNAVKVIGHAGGRDRWFLGYVPAEMAEELSALVRSSKYKSFACLYSVYQSDTDHIDINVMALVSGERLDAQTSSQALG